MPLLLAFFFAFCAYGSLAAGNVLMKKGIAWIGWKGPKGRIFLNSLLIWSTGFVVMNASGVFTALAVQRLTPEETGVFAGFGVLIMIILAKALLQEPLFPGDAAGALLIVSSISLLGFFSRSESPDVWSSPKGLSLSLILILPFLFLALGLWFKKRAAHFFALCSGLSSGILVILLKILVARHDYRVTEYLSSLFLYLYIIYAVLALVSLQISLRRAQLMVVGPLQYSSLILYPAVASPLLGLPVVVGQWPLFLGCAAGIWIILRKR